jgi:hypothetical protein
MTERAELIDPEDHDLVSARGRNAEEIRQDIAARRAAIATTVDRLSDRVDESLDWRTHVSNHPLAALGVAAGVGIVLSRVFKPRPSQRQLVFEALTNGADDTKRMLRQILKEPAVRTPGAVVRAAVIAVITRAATNYLTDRLAGTDAPESSTPPDRISRKREYTERSNDTANPAIE